MFKIISFILKIMATGLLVGCSPFIFLISIMFTKSWKETIEFTLYILKLPFQDIN
jgi:hypothetical protein